MKRDTIIQIGRNLRLLREQAGLSQQQLAGRLGVSYQQLQKYETGANRISPDKIHILKQLYDVPYDAFFFGLEGSPPEPLPKERDLDDPLARAVYWKINALTDQNMRQKIRKVVNVLAG